MKRFVAQQRRFNYWDALYLKEQTDQKLPKDDPTHYQRWALGQLLETPHLPPQSRMLARDFIHNSLYHPMYGYFSKKADIFTFNDPVDFSKVKNHLSFMDLVAHQYKRLEAHQSIDTLAKQIWHTPTELFRPWYGYSIARHLLEQARGQDLIIYEMGAGNGTLMCNILDYIQKEAPKLYQRTFYHVIEISPLLAKQQLEKGAHHRDRIKVMNQSIFDWSKRG